MGTRYVMTGPGWDKARKAARDVDRGYVVRMTDGSMFQFPPSFDPSREPWKDYELDYCRSLVMSCATREVSDASIDSYLATQIASGRRDDRGDVVNYLECLRTYWRNSPRYLAL